MSAPTAAPRGDARSDELASGAAIRLIAGREVRSRLMSKAFRWLTLGFMLVVVLGGVAMHFIASADDVKHVAVMPSAAAAQPQIEAAATATGVQVEVTTVTDETAARAQLSSGDLDVLVTSVQPTLDIVVKESLDTSLQPMFGALAQQLALIDAIEGLGGDPVAVTAEVGSAQPQVTSLEPPPEVDSGQIVAGFLAGILIFMTLMTSGQMVAQGVVEEKSSRVVELLLSTVRPWQLMAGKVLGIGLVGLVQMLLIVTSGVGTALVLGLVDTSSVSLGSAAAWSIVWFVIGFATYALVLAALAALVSRQEDVGAAIGPVSGVMIVPYIIGVSIAPWDPDNPLVVWLSYLPFCSPMLMPIRIALGTVEPWEVALAVMLSLLVIPVLVWFAGRVYSNAVLRSGSKVRLRDALRGT